MLDKLIQDSWSLGTLYLGRILSFSDFDRIVKRLPESKEYFIYTNKRTNSDISDLLSTINVTQVGFFKKEETDAINFLIDKAFKRGSNTFYVVNRPDLSISIIMPLEDVSPERCLLIKDLD